GYVERAQRLGAHVFSGETVTSWRAEGASPGAPVTLTTADTGGGGGGGGRTLTAAAVVMAAGPWMGQMVPELQELCVPERQVVGWFEIEGASRKHFAPDRFPVFVLEEEAAEGVAGGGAAYYGFPEHGEAPGFKIGLYRHLREQLHGAAALAAVRRTADAADEAALRAGAAAYFPAAGSGRLLSASACFFTNTPDGHFLVDRHPRHPQ
ncbi:Monomeric sarcosine oxidase, partial [Tetrabaena socialis]